MTVPDAKYNPTVEVKEVDGREWNEDGSLKGGIVSQVVLVDGKEYKPVASPGHHLDYEPAVVTDNPLAKDDKVSASADEFEAQK